MLPLRSPIEFSWRLSWLRLRSETTEETAYPFVWCNVFQVGTQSAKLCMRKHKRYLLTNSILRWKTLFNRLNFFESMVFCGLFCYSNVTLTKFNSLAFMGASSSTRLCGDYEVRSLYKKDKLVYLKSYYSVVSDEEGLKEYLIEMRGISDHLPYNWKRPPWRTRRRGSMQRLDLYYSDKVLSFNTVRDIIVNNKHLLHPFIRLMRDFIPCLYEDRGLKKDRSDLEKVSKVFKGWNVESQQALLCYVFSSLPLSYWSVYSFIIEDSDMRRSLICSSIDHWVSCSKVGLRFTEGDRNDYYKLTTKKWDKSGFLEKGDFYPFSF